ncbi:MAG: DUF4412 domain-containing protein [Candidatus Margulisiibacteriota bacterium]|nr:DUF4412 domain-containing protein [Candidatus Margulisiibacteriota bacterium]
MFRKMIGFSLVSVFVMVSILGCAGPSATKEFSADMVMKFGGMTQRGKIYVANNKWRTDMTVYGKKATSIIRADKKTVWSLMPGQKTYMEMKYTEDKSRGLTTKMPGEMNRKKVGSGKVNGVMCDKYKITYKSGGKSETVYQWLSKDMIPVRTKTADGSWMVEYKNIKRGKQPASVFELPAGYKKFKMPKIPGIPKGLY